MFAYDEGSGFPIVWIHGFPLSSAIFEPQTSISGFRHVRPDLPGFGHTPPAVGPTSMSSYARDILGLMDEKNIQRAVIAGFSMGGYVAMQILRDAPQRVAALLLLDTREVPDTDDGRRDRFDKLRAVEEQQTIEPVIASMLPKMIHDHTRDAAVRAIMETSSREGVVAALRAMAERPDSAETLRNAHVPTLVVVGDRDEITPPRDAERMVAMMKNAEMAPIARAGHMANWEKPEQLNPLIEAFLTRHVIRPASEHHE